MRCATLTITKIGKNARNRDYVGCVDKPFLEMDFFVRDADSILLDFLVEEVCVGEEVV